MRTPDWVLFWCCPPGPPEQKVSTRKSFRVYVAIHLRMVILVVIVIKQSTPARIRTLTNSSGNCCAIPYTTGVMDAPINSASRMLLLGQIAQTRFLLGAHADRARLALTRADRALTQFPQQLLGNPCAPLSPSAGVLWDDLVDVSTGLCDGSLPLQTTTAHASYPLFDLNGYPQPSRHYCSDT